MRAPSVRISEPGAEAARAKSTSCFEPGASATARRTRPSRSFRSTRVPRFSTAIMTGTFSVEAPPASGAAPDERLIDLNHPRQQLTVRAHDRPPQLVQPRPGGLIRSQAQHVVQVLRRRTVLREVTNQIAANHVLNGYACGERSSPRSPRSCAHSRHTSNAASRSATPYHHHTPDPKPSGQRKRARYSAHDARQETTPKLLIGPRIVHPAHREPIRKGHLTSIGPIKQISSTYIRLSPGCVTRGGRGPFHRPVDEIATVDITRSLSPAISAVRCVGEDFGP